TVAVVLLLIGLLVEVLVLELPHSDGLVRASLSEHLPEASVYLGQAVDLAGVAAQASHALQLPLPDPPDLHHAVLAPRVHLFFVVVSLHCVDPVGVRLHDVRVLVVLERGGERVPASQVLVSRPTDQRVVQYGQGGDDIEVGRVEWVHDFICFEVHWVDLVVPASVEQIVLGGGQREYVLLLLLLVKGPT
ncbi:MAG: hypothetical protein ACMG6E_09735, partial [Candidatus Roizmanbacteria bacterium]